MFSRTRLHMFTCLFPVFFLFLLPLSGHAINIQPTHPGANTLQLPSLSVQPPIHRLTLLPDLRIKPGSLQFSPNPITPNGILHMVATVENQDNSNLNRVRVRFACGTQSKDIFIRLGKKESKRVKNAIQLKNASGVLKVSVEVNPVHSELEERNYRNNLILSRVRVEEKKEDKSLHLSPAASGLHVQKPDLSLNRPAPFPVLTSVQPATLKAGRQYTLQLQGNHLTTNMRLDFGAGIAQQGAILTSTFGDRRLYMVNVRVSRKARPGKRTIHIIFKGKKRVQRPTLTVIGTTKSEGCGLEISPFRLEQGKEYQLTIYGCQFPDRLTASFDRGITVKDIVRVLGPKKALLQIKVAKTAEPGPHILTLRGEQHNQLNVLMVAPPFEARGTVEVIGSGKSRPQLIPSPKQPAQPNPILLHRITPNPLIQGKTYLLNIQGNNFTQQTIVTLDKDIQPLARPRIIGGKKILLKVRVADDARLGRHPVVLSDTQNPPTTLMAMDSGQARGFIEVKAAPFVAPKFTQPRPEISITPHLMLLKPNRWLAGKKYKVTATGTHLDMVADISFGSGIRVRHLDHQGSSTLTFTVQVDDTLKADVRFAKLITSRKKPLKTRVAAWILKPIKLAEVPRPRWPSPGEMQIRKGAIFLEDPHWRGYGDVESTVDLPVPVLNDATVFNWREEIPGLAERFEVRFLNRWGKVVYVKEIDLGHPVRHITSYKPSSRDLMELFDRLKKVNKKALQAIGRPDHSKGLTQLTAKDGQEKGKKISAMGFRDPFGKGNVVPTDGVNIATLPGVKLQPPVFTGGNTAKRESYRDKYFKRHQGKIDLLWQVVGYRTYAMASAQSEDKETSQHGARIERQGKIVIARTAEKGAKDISTEEIMVEESEQWPLNLPDQWPNGPTCDQSTELALTVDYRKPKAWDMDEDPNHYPGETIVLAGKGISIAHSPWAVSADTNYKGNFSEGIADDAYTFNNVIIDWGDGNWQPLKTNAVPGDNDAGLPGWQTSDAMDFVATHAYDYPGKFAIRIYVVPQDQMNKMDQIAAAHKYRPPSQQTAQNTSAPILLADSGMIASDAGTGFGLRGSANASAENMEMPDARIFLLYCNPIAVTIVQDTDATGPLHLDSVEITSFSSDASLGPIATNIGAVNTARPMPGRLTSKPSAIKPGVKIGTGKTGKNRQLATSSTNITLDKNQASRLAGATLGADTTVSTCEGGLWARGALRYHGQGYARIQWLVDGVAVKSRDIKIGPSEMRTDLKSPDKSTWGEPIQSAFQLDSPRLPVKETGLHRVRITAAVIPDPTFSMVNAVALRDTMRGLLSGGQGKKTKKERPGAAMPLTGKTDLHPAFIPMTSGSGKVGKSWRSQSDTLRQNLRHAFREHGLKPGRNLFMPPYSVASTVKTYKVVEHSGEMPCRFLFPVRDGEFEVISLQNLTVKGDEYSGAGKFIYKLPDGPHSKSEHYAAISFAGWQADGQNRVTRGTLAARVSETLDGLPGMKAHLAQLDGTAGDQVKAVMDVEVGDATIRLIGAEKPQTWPGVVAELTPDGDWYAEGLILRESLIGWSMTSIESTDVRLDLSQKQGAAPTGSYGGTGWVGINLGQATLHPYMFDLADVPIQVDGWNITAGGLNGQAETGGFSHVFGEGSIGWSNLKISAFHSSLSASYRDFYVEMAWPKIRIEGKNTHYSYSPGSQVDVQLGLDTDLPEVRESYDHIDMRISPKAFQHFNSGWGLMTDTEFTFRDEQGGLFADHVVANDLLFTILAEAEYTGPDIPLSIKGQVGGADELITGVRVTAGGEGDRKLSFDFTSELSMEGIGRAEAPVHILYGINRVTGRNAWDVGPDHPAEIVLKSHFPETNPAADNEFRVKYQHGSGQVACRRQPILYAASDTVMSDAWPAYPLLALSGSISGGGCGNDTFGGTIDTHLFGGNTAAIAGTFRFGKQDGARYWLGFLMGDNLHIPVYADIFIEMIQGGMAYNFDHDAFTRNNGFDACPAPGKGLLFSAGLGLSVSGPDMLRADGVLTIQPSDSFYELLAHALLFNQADLKGRIRYYQSAFDAEIWGNIHLMDNKLYLEATEHSAGFHVDSSDWFIHAGTDNNMIRGHLLELNGGVFLMLDKKGLRAGAMYKTGITKKAGGFGVEATSTFNGAVGLYLHPLRFDGRIGGYLSGKFINPIKDISIGVGTSMWMGCCNPVKLGYGFTVSCCCVKGGADIDILPSPGFHPWAKCKCCPW